AGAQGQPERRPRRGGLVVVRDDGRRRRPVRPGVRGGRGRPHRGLRPAVAHPIPERGPMTVELRSVSRWYGNVVAVNDVTMTLGPGVTGLLGPNGAGKTTG